MFLLFRNLSIRETSYLKEQLLDYRLSGAGKEVLILCAASDHAEFSTA